MNAANALTLLRLIFVPFLVYFLHQGWFGVALGVFLIAGLSDAADGFLAKRFEQQTRLGKVLDPVADKALVVTLYVALGWVGWVPFWLVLAVVSRDALIITGALIFHYLTGALEIEPTYLSKANTAVQLALLALILVDAATAWDLGWWRSTLAVVVLVTTVASGVQYILLWLRKMGRFEDAAG